MNLSTIILRFSGKNRHTFVAYLAIGFNSLSLRQFNYVNRILTFILAFQADDAGSLPIPRIFEEKPTDNRKTV